jgi:hypothetical protein
VFEVRHSVDTARVWCVCGVVWCGVYVVWCGVYVTGITVKIKSSNALGLFIEVPTSQLAKFEQAMAANPGKFVHCQTVRGGYRYKNKV